MISHFTLELMEQLKLWSCPYFSRPKYYRKDVNLGNLVVLDL